MKNSEILFMSNKNLTLSAVAIKSSVIEYEPTSLKTSKKMRSYLSLFAFVLIVNYQLLIAKLRPSAETPSFMKVSKPWPGHRIG